MGETIVVYQSKYGASKQYAQMIAQKLCCNALDLRGIKPEKLKPYGEIILCGGLYASGMAGLAYFKKHGELLKKKKVVLFAVGASPYNEKAVAQIKAHNLKDELSELPFFYGRGTWNKEKMTWNDRTLCTLLQKAVAKKDPEQCESWETALLEAGGGNCNWVDEKYLLPVWECLGV